MNLIMRIFFLILLALSLVGTAFAEPAWKASIGVSEEYSDNPGEEHDAEEDFITSLRPSLSFNHEGGRFLFQSSYSGDYRHYARGTQDEEFNHNANVHALLEAAENFFFLDVADIYRLVNEDRTKGDVTEDDSTTGLVQQNTFTFSPYITPRFGERAGAKIGYAYSNIWYDDEDRDSKNIHRGFIDGDYELTEAVSLLSGYSYTQELSEDDTLDRHIAYLGGSYAYSGSGSVYLKIGPQYTHYRDDGSSSTGVYWDAGLNHDFGPVQLALTTGISFDDDPDTGETYERRFVTARVTRPWERTTLSVFTSFEDYEDSADGGRAGVDEERDSADTGSVRRMALGLNLSHDFTARLTGTAGLTHDVRDDDDNTKRWMANLGLNYALSESMSLSAWYRFKDSSSDDEDEDYQVNRVGIQLTYLF